MKGEDQILELLAEVLRRQDQAQEKLQRITEEMQDAQQDAQSVKQDAQAIKQNVQGLKQDVQGLKVQLGTVLESPQGHQQALRTLAINQQKSQSELQNIVDILDSVARNAIPIAGSTAWSIRAISPN